MSPGVERTAFFHAALAVALGMTAQVLATRFALPGIILLLMLGIGVGPSGIGLLDPSALGSARTELVSLAVTVILFEGGLALRVETLRQQQRSLLLLLTVGAAISMLTGTLAAHFVLNMPWSVASLYGALMIVTGPTVVTPLLARITVDRSVRELLVSEGVLGDPIGAIIAILVAEYVLGQSHAWEVGGLLFVRIAAGGGIGGVAALGFAALLKRDWVPRELRNTAVLSVVLLVAASASRLSAEAGLMAAVTQGVVLSNTGLRELGRLRQFKEELTVLLLSFIFILLAADLPLGAVQELGWPALLVVALLVWVGRPLSVFLCTIHSELSIRQRLFIAWMCPRGIVAAAVAGLFGILLKEAGLPDGDRLEALVFVTVALTVTVQGLTAGPVARLLLVDLPALQGMIIIGADVFGRLLARRLMEQGRPVVLMDLSREYCRSAKRDGFMAYNGDALQVEDLDDAGAHYADTVLAMTRNQELNELITQRVRENFRVERAIAVSTVGSDSQNGKAFPGHFPGIDAINRLLIVGGIRQVEYLADGEGLLGRQLRDLPYAEGEFAILLTRRGCAYVATGDQVLTAKDSLVCLATNESPSPLALSLELTREAEALGYAPTRQPG